MRMDDTVHAVQGDILTREAACHEILANVAEVGANLVQRNRGAPPPPPPVQPFVGAPWLLDTRGDPAVPSVQEGKTFGFD